mmetsp:Transcript_9559/g.20673  ORF Transcript_9559/g.20673 Transcript_9559/m.20673 type:complete len:219 (+) Transcript_9559:1725-2381(+)
MLLRLRAFVVSLGVRNSIKAYLPNISQRVIGFPSMMLRPTCPMAVPKKSLSILSVISGVVFPTNNSRLTFSDSPSRTASIVSSLPVSSCQVFCTTKGPVYFLGLPTLILAFKNKTPLMLRHLLAYSTVTISTKAKFPELICALRQGVSWRAQSLACRMAPFRKWSKNLSSISDGMFPTNNSRSGGMSVWVFFCCFLPRSQRTGDRERRWRPPPRRSSS